jgi:hypothetical protein
VADGGARGVEEVRARVLGVCVLNKSFFCLQMADPVVIYGQTEGGRHSGSVYESHSAYYVNFHLPHILETYRFSDYGSKEDAHQAATKRRDELSLQHGLTKNRFRRAWLSDSSDEWLEVHTTQGIVMKCDIEHLPSVQAYPWHAYKGGNTFYIRTQINGKKIRFHNLVTKLDKVDHINKDGTDNRLRNLRATTDELNARNRRVGKNNTSGRIGVSERNGWVITKWPLGKGKSKSRYFSIAKHGHDEARRLAYALRAEREKEIGITPDVNIESRPPFLVPSKPFKPFSCPKCDRKYSDRSALRDHVTKKHAE